jgi:hypothetical protein
MKTIKKDYRIKIFLLILLIGCSNASKTSFGLLKKTNKKVNTNNNSQNLYQNTSQNVLSKAKKIQTIQEPNNENQTNENQTNENTVPLPKPTMKKEDDNRHVSTLSDQPIYAQGWIKYLHYEDKSDQKPKKFWKNTLFETEQRIEDKNTNPKKDEVNKSFFL